MAGDARRALIRLAYMSYLDGARPSTVRGWVNPVAPVVVQAATGAGHWSAGRRQRALAEWAGAAGFGLAAWGLGTEAPTPAEVQQHHQRLMRDVMRERGITAPAAARTETPAARRIERFFRWFGLVSPVAEVVLSVPWRLRHPQRLTVLAIAMEAPNVGYGVLRADRGRAAAQAEDGRGLSPGRSRIASPAAGRIG